MTIDALFDLPPDAEQRPNMAELSAGGRRRVRQTEAVRNGVHPLALVVRGVQMHPDADRDAASTDRPNLPLRCGSCWHRGPQGLGHYAGTYPKCFFSQTRITHGDGTTVRAWWPACTDYSPGDPTLSDDAARYTPGGAA